MAIKQNTSVGISMTLIAIVLFSFMDIVVTTLGREDYPTAQIMFFRAALSIPITLVVLIYSRDLPKLKTQRPYLHLLRCVAGSLAMFLVFYTFSKLDVATVTSLWSSSPILVTIFSFFFLKEQVGIYRWSAVILGFVGVLIIRPPQTFELLSALPLIAAALTAIVVIALRILGKTEPASVTAFFFAITSTVVALILSIGTEWKTPSTFDWLLLISTSIFGTAGQLLSAHALRITEASLVMPLRYIGIVILMILAYIFFREIPSWQTLIGATLIICAGVFTVYREIYRKRQKANIP